MPVMCPSTPAASTNSSMPQPAVCGEESWSRSRDRDVRYRRRGPRGSAASLLFVAFGFGVEVLEGAGFDAAGFDEGVDFFGFESDDAAEPVCGDVGLVDEPVEGARGDAQSL